MIEQTGGMEVRNPTLLLERPAWISNDLGAPTGAGIDIGVIDSGWDHILPIPQICKGVGFVDPQDELALLQSDDDQDRNGHGTACTELIHRIAPEARLHPIRVFGRRLETSVSMLQAAILYAIEHRYRLVNLSLGTVRAETLHALYTTCEQARRAGLVLVAATHNSRVWSYPAVFENVISVGSGSFDSAFDYAYRPGEAVECLARGNNQLVRWLEGRTVLMSGTSFAAPNITGIIALFLERYPAAALEEVRDLLARYAAPSNAER